MFLTHILSHATENVQDVIYTRNPLNDCNVVKLVRCGIYEAMIPHWKNSVTLGMEYYSFKLRDCIISVDGARCKALVEVVVGLE